MICYDILISFSWLSREWCRIISMNLYYCEQDHQHFDEMNKSLYKIQFISDFSLLLFGVAKRSTIADIKGEKDTWMKLFCDFRQMKCWFLIWFWFCFLLFLFMFSFCVLSYFVYFSLFLILLFVSLFWSFLLCLYVINFLLTIGLR